MLIFSFVSPLYFLICFTPVIIALIFRWKYENATNILELTPTDKEAKIEEIYSNSIRFSIVAAALIMPFFIFWLKALISTPAINPEDHESESLYLYSILIFGMVAIFPMIIGGVFSAQYIIGYFITRKAVQEKTSSILDNSEKNEESDIKASSEPFHSWVNDLHTVKNPDEEDCQPGKNEK